MKVKLLSNFLKVMLAFLVSYLLFLALFFTQSVSLYLESKDIYAILKSNGFNQDAKKNYQALLTKLDKFTSAASSPLVTPLVKLAGYQRELDLALEFFQETKQLLPVAPPILGYKKPQRYLVAFQNSAEARGTGGIIGAYAVISLDKAQLKIIQLGTNSKLQSLQEIPIEMPRNFRNLYGSDPAIWQNSNLSPHFPYGAKIWLALWERQFKEELDGVIALDPIILSSLLKLTGPIMVQDRTINSKNVVRETLSRSYIDFERDNIARKEFLVEIIRETFAKLKIAKIDAFDLLKEMNSPRLDERILFYSTNQKIQRDVLQSSFSGALSKSNSSEYRLVVQNVAGNKMDYYLKRSLILESLKCAVPRITRATIRLTNTAPHDLRLPNYVRGRLDLGLIEGKGNSTSLSVLMYGPSGSKVISSIDESSGNSIGYLKKERGRELLVFSTELLAGESKTVIIEFQGGAGEIASVEQPLVIPQKTTIVDRCNQ